VATWQEINFGP